MPIEKSTEQHNKGTVLLRNVVHGAEVKVSSLTLATLIATKFACWVAAVKSALKQLSSFCSQSFLDTDQNS